MEIDIIMAASIKLDLLIINLRDVTKRSVLDFELKCICEAQNTRKTHLLLYQEKNKLKHIFHCFKMYNFYYFGFWKYVVQIFL